MVRAMPETNPAKNDGTAPEGLENSALTPDENKRANPAAAPAPAAPVELVEVQLLQHYNYLGEDLVPGAKPKLPAPLAATLIRAQWAKPAGK